MSTASLNQFQGCLAGVLVGDSLGFPYERVPRKKKFPNTLEFIQDDLEKIKMDQMIPYERGFKKPVLSGSARDYRQYTDDTSMTVTLGKFLAESKKSLDFAELARGFCAELEVDKPMRRMYGPGTKRILGKIEAGNFKDVFQYAAEEFGGEGSLGNGASMRIAPVALYTISNPGLESLVDIAIDVSRLTHAHPQGIFGGIFQALGVRQALIFGAKDDREKPTAAEFLDVFESEFKSILTNEAISKRVAAYQAGQEIYQEKIRIIRELLRVDPDSWDLEKIRKGLGNLVTSPKSVPTALFCFLASFQKIPFIATDDHFQKTITLVYALGGDTDTIGAMAGAICGAYVGLDGIHKSFVNSCEAYQKVLSVAEQLYNKCYP